MASKRAVVVAIGGGLLAPFLLLLSSSRLSLGRAAFLPPPVHHHVISPSGSTATPTPYRHQKAKAKAIAKCSTLTLLLAPLTTTDSSSRRLPTSTTTARWGQDPRYDEMPTYDSNSGEDKDGEDEEEEYDEEEEEMVPYPTDPAAELLESDASQVDIKEEHRQMLSDEYEAYYADVEFNTAIEIDEDGVEKMWDPVFGRSNPVDERAIVTPLESYVVANKTRDDATQLSQFPDDDPESEYNQEVKRIRHNMKKLETYHDPWLQMEVPRNVRRWHGTRDESDKYEEKPYMNNRFTKPEDKTDFTKLDPYRARKTAVQMARAKNNEWLPEGLSDRRRAEETKKFREYNLLVGSLQRGECNPKIVKRIQPALRVLGDVADLLSIQGAVFRFHYHGQMKNRRGMATWTEKMIRECGVECTGVVFETGRRKLDDGDNVFRTE